jgi:hypothetical protein
MEKPNHRPTEYFSLPYGNIQHHHKPLAEIADREIGFGEFEPADKPQDGKSKNPQRDQNGECKNYLFYHNPLIYKQKMSLK